MTMLSTAQLEPNNFYKTINTCIGTGIFYLTEKRAFSYKQVYSYPINDFCKIFSNSTFLKYSFEDVIMELYEANERNAVLGVKLNLDIFDEIAEFIRNKRASKSQEQLNEVYAG